MRALALGSLESRLVLGGAAVLLVLSLGARGGGRLRPLRLPLRVPVAHLHEVDDETEQDVPALLHGVGPPDQGRGNRISNSIAHKYYQVRLRVFQRRLNSEDEALGHKVHHLLLDAETVVATAVPEEDLKNANSRRLFHHPFQSHAATPFFLSSRGRFTHFPPSLY